MLIRLAEPTDAIAIHAVFVAAVLSVAEYTEEERRDWANQVTFEGFQDRVERGMTWVAEEEELVVGFITLMPEDEELRSIYVHVDYQGKGIGGALMERAIEEAKALDWKHLRIKASRNGMGFYESFGFRDEFWGVDDGTSDVCTRMVKPL